MYRSLALLSAAMLLLLAVPAHAEPEVAHISVYLDDPVNYANLQAQSVIVCVQNRSKAPMRSLDYAGFRLWRIGPSGEWTAIPPLGSDTPAVAAQEDPDPDLVTLTLEIASADSPCDQRLTSTTVSRGIGYIVIDRYRMHLYCVDVGRYLSQPGRYSLKAVLTRNDKPIAESSVRSLTIAPTPKAGGN